VALVIVAALAAQDARPKIEVTRASRCDGGGTSKFDADRVERNYREAAAALQRALSSFEKKAVAKLEDGYDAGLPDAARKLRRTWRPSKPLPEQVRGITIYVVTVDRNGSVRGLPEGAPRRSDVVLISRAARLKDCTRLAPVTFLTRELAAALGMRSSRGRCVISADGTEIEVTEGDRP
jgi:hypothetical protein